MAKEILGRIDCPYCKLSQGIRVTHDKNGMPFGYCDGGCHGQMKVGGDAFRVGRFVDQYPWAAPLNTAKTVSVQVREPEPEAPKPSLAPAPVQQAKPKPEPKPQRKPVPNPFEMFFKKEPA